MPSSPAKAGDPARRDGAEIRLAGGGVYWIARFRGQ
jgi:hypothetical protein